MRGVPHWHHTNNFTCSLKKKNKKGKKRFTCKLKWTPDNEWDKNKRIPFSNYLIETAIYK